MNETSLRLRRPAATQSCRVYLVDDDVVFPDGVYCGRRVLDVVAHDPHPPFARESYVRHRAERPRPSWPADVVNAVRVAAFLLEPAA